MHPSDLEVTATLLANFIILARRAEDNPSADVQHDQIFFTDANSEYVGANSFVPHERPSGDGRPEPVFLEDGELKVQNFFISDKVLSMWDDAALQDRSMLLDVTTPHVTVAGNSSQKAERLLERHPHAVAIVVTGAVIKWKAGSGARVAASGRNTSQWKCYKG